jgi:hypothetical protein
MYRYNHKYGKHITQSSFKDGEIKNAAGMVWLSLFMEGNNCKLQCMQKSTCLL